ncbi:unnamed protein product [Diamesa serratosioi]
MPAISNNKLYKSTTESESLIHGTEKKTKPKIKWSVFQERCLKLICEFEKNEEELFAFKYKIEYYGVNVIDPQVYYSIIKKPMYLKKVCHNIKSGKYKDEFDVIDDVNLIFENALTYNHPNTKYNKIAKELQMTFNDKATRMMKNLGYCCGSSYKRIPPIVSCNGAAKNCFIKLGSVYHIFVKKSDFEDKKMTNCVPDLYIKCGLCLKRFHRICVMYFEELEKQFTCVNCSANCEVKTIKLKASALPQNNCSIFIQNELDKNGLNVDGKLTIRVLSDKEISFSTSSQYSEKIGEYQISYRNRAVFAFHEINGDDVCFFGAYLQVYDAKCSVASNRKTIYLSYLDSVNLKKHIVSRTKIFQHVLLGLFHFYKQQGYKKVCIWSCPPKKRSDYMFNVKPVDQKIPNQKRLTAWYRDLFRVGMKSGAIEDFKNILQYALQQKWKTIEDLPYYDGDLWPLRIEVSIKESIAYLDQMNKKLLYLDLKSPYLTADKRNKMMKLLIQIHDMTLEKEIMQRTMKLLKYYSTDYFVVILNTESNMREKRIDNTIKSCEFINSRHKFMEYFVDNNYEFSDVLQSRYSSFMMIYELYKEHRICKDCLQSNVLDDALVPRLKCQACHKKETDEIKIKDTVLQPIEIHDVYLNNSVEADDETVIDQFVLVNDSIDTVADQLVPDEYNPYLNFNQAEIISNSPIVMIEKLDTEFVTFFLRNNQTKGKTKKHNIESNDIKKPSPKKLKTRKVQDAWGKMPSGIFAGNSFDFGSFDQCLNVHYESNIVEIGQIIGKYCTLLIPYKKPQQILQKFMPPAITTDITLGIGVCVPNSCSNEQIKTLAGNRLQSQNQTALIFSCTTQLQNEFPIESLQISAITFFSFILLLMIASTIYEIVCISKKCKKSATLSSFSVYSNTIAIFTLEPSTTNELKFVHGIRALSIIWIVIGHTYLTFLMVPAVNANSIIDWFKNVSSMPMVSGVMGVDTFFLLSAMLMTLSVFRELDKTFETIKLLVDNNYLNIVHPTVME